MGIFDFFKNFGKIKGEDIRITITLKKPIPYPDKDTRSKHLKQISPIFDKYYRVVAVMHQQIYLKNANGEFNFNEPLRSMAIICHQSKFSYKGSDEKEFLEALFKEFCDSISAVLPSLGIEGGVDIEFQYGIPTGPGQGVEILEEDAKRALREVGFPQKLIEDD